MKLSDRIKDFRADRPDEWTMDDFSREADWLERKILSMNEQLKMDDDLFFELTLLKYAQGLKNERTCVGVLEEHDEGCVFVVPTVNWNNLPIGSEFYLNNDISLTNSMYDAAWSAFGAASMEDLHKKLSVHDVRRLFKMFVDAINSYSDN